MGLSEGSFFLTVESFLAMLLDSAVILAVTKLWRCAPCACCDRTRLFHACALAGVPTPGFRMVFYMVCPMNVESDADAGVGGAARLIMRGVLS